MKTKAFFRLATLLAISMLLPVNLCGQVLHRYVIEVTTEPSELDYNKTDNHRTAFQRQRKTVYYEIISAAPLTLEQCNDSIRLGKARRVPNPHRTKKTEYDLWNRKNMTMDGEEGINPWDVEQTEYDLKYEDPDLYDFIAD